MDSQCWDASGEGPKNTKYFSAECQVVIKNNSSASSKGGVKVFNPFNTSSFLMATSSIFSFLTRLYVTPGGTRRKRGEEKEKIRRGKKETLANKGWNDLSWKKDGCDPCSLKWWRTFCFDSTLSVLSDAKRQMEVELAWFYSEYQKKHCSERTVRCT